VRFICTYLVLLREKLTVVDFLNIFLEIFRSGHINSAKIGLSRPAKFQINESLSELNDPSIQFTNQYTDTVNYSNEIYEEFCRGMDYFSKAKYLDSLKCFEICSQSNYPPSFLMMGYIYSKKGIRGPTNDSKIQHYLSLTIKHSSFFEEDNHQDSSGLLIFCQGLYFYMLKEDDKQAAKYFKLSAEKRKSFWPKLPWYVL